MKLSLSGRLWESPTGYRINLKQHIIEAAKIGYEGIEVRYPLLPKLEETSSFRKILMDNKIRAVFAFCAGLPQDEQSTADALRVIKTVKELGGSLVRIVLTKEEDMPFLKKLAQIAEDSSINIAIHLHTGTFCDSVDKTLRVLDLLNASNACILFDAIHLLMAGETDLAGAITRLAGRIGLVNIQNFKKVPDNTLKSHRIYGNNGLPVPPDDPDGINFRELISLLKKNGYNGWLNVMCTTGENEDPLAVAKDYFDVLKPLI